MTKSDRINAWNIIRYCCSCSDVEYPTRELDTIADALIAYDKHRWHDLRKNPNDLPAENALCVIKTISNARLDYDICIFMPNRRLCWDSEITEYANSMTYAIAWKEIEPFEVSE